jgi:hypothetical protein
MKEKLVEDVADRRRALALRCIRIPVSTSAPKGAVIKEESGCLPDRRAFAKDIRLVGLSGNDIEKPGGYQEKTVGMFPPGWQSNHDVRIAALNADQVDLPAFVGSIRRPVKRFIF